jgi:hypothetical protein
VIEASNLHYNLRVSVNESHPVHGGGSRLNFIVPLDVYNYSRWFFEPGNFVTEYWVTLDHILISKQLPQNLEKTSNSFKVVYSKIKLASKAEQRRVGIMCMLAMDKRGML